MSVMDNTLQRQTAATTGTRPVPAIRLSGVTKHFGKVEAVRGIDLTVQSGEIVAFLGPNGAGKTTTIDMVLGLSDPTQGEVEVYGMSPRRAINHGLVSAVMQTGGLLKDFTVEEILRYTASVFAQPANPSRLPWSGPASTASPPSGRQVLRR